MALGSAHLLDYPWFRSDSGIYSLHFLMVFPSLSQYVYQNEESQKTEDASKQIPNSRDTQILRSEIYRLIMQKPRILMVNLGLPPESLGGTEYYTLNLSKSLVSAGHSVGVFCALSDLAQKRYTLSHSMVEGVDVFKVSNSYLQVRQFKDFFIDEVIDEVFLSVIEKFQPDLIHFHHLAYLSGNLPEIADTLDIPSLMTLHDYWYMCFRSRLLRPGNQICSGPAAGLHCASCDDGVAPHPTKVPKHPNLLQFLHSPQIKKVVEKGIQIVPQEQIATMRAMISGSNGAEEANIIEPTAELIDDHIFRSNYFKRQLEYPKVVLSPSLHLKQRYEFAGFRQIDYLPLGFEPVSPLAPLPFNGILKLSYIGSIEPHKGLRELIRELSLLDLQQMKIELNVHGHAKDPIYDGQVKKLAAALPEGSIQFHGAYKSDRDLAGILENCHFAVFPSIWEENHPLVVREALLHGRPVISTNLGGAPEVITHFHNGILYNPFNQGELAQLLPRIANPTEINNLHQGAVQTEIETMQDHINKLTRLYLSILEEKTGVNGIQHIPPHQASLLEV